MHGMNVDPLAWLEDGIADSHLLDLALTTFYLHHVSAVLTLVLLVYNSHGSVDFHLLRLVHFLFRC